MDDPWLNDCGNTLIAMVHGHTPVKGPDILVYADRHKIDIDLASYKTGRTCLLNLDSLLPIYFEI